MNTVVRCSRGHQWEVRPPGGDTPPQLVCPVCGARVEGLVEQGTLTEVVNEPTANTRLAMACRVRVPGRARLEGAKVMRACPMLGVERGNMPE